MNNMSSVWFGSRLSLATMLCIYQTCIFSILLYGTTHESFSNQLCSNSGFSTGVFKSIYSMSNGTLSSEISELTGLPFIPTITLTHRLSLCSYVIRLADDTPANHILNLAAARSAATWGSLRILYFCTCEFCTVYNLTTRIHGTNYVIKRLNHMRLQGLI